jgi:N-methylhydantoinase A/oxoprolinase/acetone carboxylase beta subunit
MIKYLLRIENRILSNIICKNGISERKTDLEIGLIYSEKTGTLQIGGKNCYLIEYISLTTQYFIKEYEIKSYKNGVIRIISKIPVKKFAESLEHIKKQGITLINVESLERLMR